MTKLEALYFNIGFLYGIDMPFEWFLRVIIPKLDKGSPLFSYFCLSMAILMFLFLGYLPWSSSYNLFFLPSLSSDPLLKFEAFKKSPTILISFPVSGLLFFCLSISYLGFFLGKLNFIYLSWYSLAKFFFTVSCTWSRYFLSLYFTFVSKFKAIRFFSKLLKLLWFPIPAPLLTNDYRFLSTIDIVLCNIDSLASLL